MALPTLDKGKIVTIVQLVLSLLALILSIVAMAGAVADNFATLKGSSWLSIEMTVYGTKIESYSGFAYTCSGNDDTNVCQENEWDGKGGATAMGVLSFIFAIVYLGMVAVKLFKPIKMLNMAECGVGLLGMIFTLVCFAIWAGYVADQETKPLDNGAEYGPGYGSCVAAFVFKLFALVLGVLTLLPAFATTEVAKAPEAAAGNVGNV